MKYTVLITRDVTESTVIEVEAESKEAAADRALLAASWQTANWERNDFSEDSPYLGGGIENDVTAEGEQAVIR